MRVLSLLPLHAHRRSGHVRLRHDLHAALVARRNLLQQVLLPALAVVLVLPRLLVLDHLLVVQLLGRENFGEKIDGDAEECRKLTCCIISSPFVYACDVTYSLC